MTVVLVLITLAVSWLPPMSSDAALLDQACRCNRARSCPGDEYLLQLLDYEKAVGLPQSLRGMTLAASCHESGFSTKAKGDRKFHPKRKPMAIGILQMWPWWEKKYGDIRRDPHEAPKRYLEAVAAQVPKVKSRCRFGKKDEEKAWLVAWVRVARGRVTKCIRRHEAAGTLTDRQLRSCHRCFEGTTSKHYKRLRKWKRRAAKADG